MQVTEWDEPQAVIGSYLHRYAYPDWFAGHEKRDRAAARGARPRDARARSACVALRGEYLYAAEGAGGMRVYDVANIANKGVSQRIVTAPFSPLGHDTHVASKNATCVALPTNQPINPLRNQGELMRDGEPGAAVPPDLQLRRHHRRARKGLILVDVDTLADGEPRNNFLKRAVTWNPRRRARRRAPRDARRALRVRRRTDAGIVVVDLDDPLKPRVAAQVPLRDARASALQFRYLFVADARRARAWST